MRAAAVPLQPNCSTVRINKTCDYIKQIKSEARNVFEMASKKCATTKIMIAHGTNIQQRITPFLLRLFLSVRMFLCFSASLSGFSRCCCNVRLRDRGMNLSLRRLFMRTFAFFLLFSIRARCYWSFKCFRCKFGGLSPLFSNAVSISFVQIKLYSRICFFPLRAMWLWWFLLFVCGFVFLVICKLNWCN